MSGPSIAVIGTGRMGSGIVHSFAVSGTTVALVDADADRAAIARDGVVRGLETAAQRGFVSGDVEEIASRISSFGSVVDLPRDIDVVIEAVPEIPRLKTEILAMLSEHFSDETIVASNTSSISIDELAMSVGHPDRFVGMHFFNPVPASKLVEVVQGAVTDPAVVARTVELVEFIGKQPIVVADAPGFASSRLGVLLGLEAIRMLEEGVASADDIDRAMELGYGHRMGPLRSTDLVGLDVRLSIADYLAGELGERFAPPQLMRDMVAEGRLGRKSGRGFFDWAD